MPEKVRRFFCWEYLGIQISIQLSKRAKNIISGASANPGIVTIKKICDGLDISIVEFFDTEAFRALEQEII